MKKILFLSFLLITGCKTDGNNISVEDGKAVMLTVKKYVDNHPNNEKFLLIDSWGDIFSKEEYPSGYILGPYYKGMIKQIDEFPYIDIGKSRIYIKSLTLQKCNENEVYITYTSHADSSDKEYYIINDAWSDYIYKAMFLYKKDGNWRVNHRPDTIFIPKRVESNIHF